MNRNNTRITRRTFLGRSSLTAAGLSGAFFTAKGCSAPGTTSPAASGQAKQYESVSRCTKEKIYNPLWDKSRTHLPERFYEDEDIILASNFECGNGYNFYKLGVNHYFFEVEPEPGEHSFSNKGYYFCTAVLNKLDEPTTVTIEVKGGREIFADGSPEAQVNKHVILKRGNAWSHIPEHKILPPVNNQTMVFELDLPANTDIEPIMYISNFHWYPYTEMTEYLRHCAGNNSDLDLLSIGKSHQGRDIWAVEIGLEDQDAPTIVCAQSPQPSEMGHWACQAIMDFLISDDPIAREVLSKQRVCLVPNTNPDGTVMGYSVSDTQGNFPYLQADRAVLGQPDASGEVVALWNYLRSKSPWLFIEWHSNNWSSNLRKTHVLLRYDRNLISSPAIGRLWENFENRLDQMPDNVEESRTTYGTVFSTTMGFFAATQLNTIPIMIKLHDKYPFDHSMKHVLKCFFAAIDAYDEFTQPD